MCVLIFYSCIFPFSPSPYQVHPIHYDVTCISSLQPVVHGGVVLRTEQPRRGAMPPRSRDRSPLPDAGDRRLILQCRHRCYHSNGSWQISGKFIAVTESGTALRARPPPPRTYKINVIRVMCGIFCVFVGREAFTVIKVTISDLPNIITIIFHLMR